MEPKQKPLLSLSSSFSLCQGWGAAHNVFTASSDSLFHPPLSLVFFLQSSSSPASRTSLLTQSSHLSLGLPRLLLPFSRNSAALFGSLSSPIFQRVLPTVVWSSPVSLLSSSAPLSLALTPPFFSCTYALVTLAIFRTQLFSHTCSLCCCSSVSARGFRSAQACPCHTSAHVLALESFWDPPVRHHPSTALHAFAPACALRRTSLSVFPSPHTVPPMYTKLFPWVSFFPSSSMSSSSLWWPTCSTCVFPRFIFNPCQVYSPFYSSSVTCSSCLPFATRTSSSA